uniref:Rhamnulokinase n=1 Tax=candidate division WOR-3 bacterium TaxID=2052148 RepID=A0A7C6AG19_UNCW3
MSDTYLAFDLGAESGRAILGRIKKGKLTIKEIHRFSNKTIRLSDGLHWDIEHLLREIKNGLKFAFAESSGLKSIGIDTWGVDFGLFDENEKLLAPPFSYRDPGTRGLVDKFSKLMKKEELYKRTGIQLLEINTIYRLYAMILSENEILKRAHSLLLLPDIFNLFFTGIKASEFTFATTTQLFNPVERDWDSEVLKCLNIKRGLFQKIAYPGMVLGKLKKDFGQSDIDVVLVASHDTASAVAAVPANQKDFIYISSGTWSLMGIESDRPIINQKSFEYNFTNEGGIGQTFRFLKNILGLGILHSCKKEWEGKQYLDYNTLINLARNEAPFLSIINPFDIRFLSPRSMTEEIKKFCIETGQQSPQTIGQFVRCILESLSLAYRHTLEQIKEITDRDFTVIHIIGGGSLNEILCQFTADATGIPVYAGPVEATAIGNILTQAMAKGELNSMNELRNIVRKSFPFNEYIPGDTKSWDDIYGYYRELVNKNFKKGRKL